MVSKNDRKWENRELADSDAIIACVTTIRRIVMTITKDKEGLRQILQIIYPIIVNSLTSDFDDTVDEVLDSVNIILYYAYDKQTRVPPELWQLLPRMYLLTAGKDEDMYGGHSPESINHVAVIVQNLINKDPQTLLAERDGEIETYLVMTNNFIQKFLLMNSQSNHKQDGVVVLRILISLLENLPEQINHAMPNIVGVLLAEIKAAFSGKC